MKMGKRLSLGETLDLLLEESESVKHMENTQPGPDEVYVITAFRVRRRRT